MHEQFYEEQETSAMKELRNKGFRKLNVRHINGYQETSIYNNESLHISVCLGEDYNLAGRQHEITSDFKVDSYISWNTGYAVILHFPWREVWKLLGLFVVQSLLRGRLATLVRGNSAQ